MVESKDYSDIEIEILNKLKSIEKKIDNFQGFYELTKKEEQELKESISSKKANKKEIKINLN